MNIDEMLSNKTIKDICEYYEVTDANGTISPYIYKSATKLINTLERKFNVSGLNDLYAKKCSRWMLVELALEQIWNEDRYNDFFNTILSQRYFKSENPTLSPIDCAKASEKAFNDFNNILLQDDYELTKLNNTYVLRKIDSCMEKIGNGGFATVYRIYGTNLVSKVLNDEHRSNEGTVSRFTREFNICKELESEPGVIKVYDFDKTKLSYTMEYHECDLSKFIKCNVLTEQAKDLIVCEMLDIMKRVHSKDIIHRDLSPHNIFIENGRPIISDFGLGKNLNSDYSHQTYDTALSGTPQYCDPRQYSSLSNGDKQADVYSLGKLINFIFMKDPENFEHKYKIISLKATTQDLNDRYKDAGELYDSVLSGFNRNEMENARKSALDEIRKGHYNKNMDQYLKDFTGLNLIYQCHSNKYFLQGYKKFLSYSNDNVLIEHILSNTYDEMNQVRVDWNLVNEFGYLMIDVLSNDKFSNGVKQQGSKILYKIACEFNRFAVQGRFKKEYRANTIKYDYVSNIVDYLKDEL